MSVGYDYDATQPVRGPRSLTSEQATAVVAGVALVLLIAIRRGFRGVNVGGVGVNIR